MSDLLEEDEPAGAGSVLFNKTRAVTVSARRMMRGQHMLLRSS